MSLPRYVEFGSAVQELVKQGVRFREIAGNQEILLTALAPRDLELDHALAERVVLAQPILTDATHQRIAATLPVTELHQLLPAMEQSGIQFEHLYDY